MEPGIAGNVLRPRARAHLPVPFVVSILCVVGALAADTDDWLVLAPLYVGASVVGGLALSAIRLVQVRKELEAAPAHPADAVEARRTRHWAWAVGLFVAEAALVLGFAWLWSLALGDPYSGGVVFAATVVMAIGVADVAEARTRIAWERRRA